MGRVWTHDDWNDIIRRVNERAEQCEPGDPLPEAPAGHKWSMSDIMEVRGRLEWLCRNAPESWAETWKWKQAVIDELNETIDDCVCGCTQTLIDDMRSLHGLSSYVPYLLYPTQFTKNEWFIEEPDGGGHWQFQWTYRQDYDFTIAIGYGYGQQGVNNVRHAAKWHIEYWYDPWGGSPEHITEVHDLGIVDTNCDGTVTSAPSGTFIKVFPVDYRLLLQPSGYPFTVWDTASAACC